MSVSIWFVLLFSLTSVTTIKCYDCGNVTDGAHEISCQSYTRCTNGKATVIQCHIPFVVNPLTLQCDSQWNVTTLCGVFRDCSYRDNGNYPEVETGCHWYYTCSYGMFERHQHCPAGLVLNTNLQICDFAYNVPPPCGTKGP